MSGPIATPDRHPHRQDPRGGGEPGGGPQRNPFADDATWVVEGDNINEVMQRLE